MELNGKTYEMQYLTDEEVDVNITSYFEAKSENCTIGHFIDK